MDRIEKQPLMAEKLPLVLICAPLRLALKFKDVEVFEYASQKKGEEVLNALRAQDVPTS
tara:strand:+ start:356 stop:532 length:177 start_codon:yes stop_codon:yes gene_type:complete